MMILILILLGIIFFVVSLLSWAGAFNELAELQFAEHHDEWLKDGKPSGYGASQNEAGFRILGTVLCSLKWLAKSPDWAEMNLKAKPITKRMRLWLACLWLHLHYCS